MTPSAADNNQAMSLSLVLVLLALGAAWSQALSAPRTVTLRWLRLGDLIALSLLAGALALRLAGRGHDAAGAGYNAVSIAAVALAAGLMAHLMLVQLGRWHAQRAAAIANGVVASLALALPYVWPGTPWGAAIALQAPPGLFPGFAAGLGLILAAWLLGGSLMAMLLGHAYLTAGGEMTQRPFLRLSRLILAGLAARGILAAAAALWPWWRAYSQDAWTTPQLNNALWILTRFLVGLAVPMVLTWMAIECVRLRSNQSATGILYVSSTMILLGEILALALFANTGLPF